MKKVLKIIKDQLTAAGLDYQFMRVSKPRYPYFVGEIFESETLQEDGQREYTILLTGFTRKDYLELLDAAETIEQLFPPEIGTVFSEDRSSVVINYAGAHPVETGNEELKRIEITLKIKEWRG